MSREIKLESAASAGEICQGCLSQGRFLRPLGAHSEVFYTLLGNSTGYNFVMGSDTMKMCWECIARLDRVQQFRIQLCQAQNRLMEMLYDMNTNITSLSSLSKTTKNVFDYEFNHKPIEDNILNIKPIVEPEAIVLDVEPDNVSLIKLEKLADDEITPLNEEHFTDYTDNYNDELPTKYTDTILKKEINMKELKPIKKERKKFKTIKKKDYYNREYKNRSYHEQVIVKKLNVNFDKLSLEETTKYFDKVYLDEIEVEEYVCKKDREVHRSFKHRCKECKIGFMATADLYRHQNFEHHKAGTPYKCRLCNKTQPTLDSLKRHWKFAHSQFYVCKLCNFHVRLQGRTKHLKQQHMKKYCCTGCQLEFQTMLAFSAHYRKDHGKFICDYCGKVCHQKSVLIRHINSHHIIHECQICVKSFKSYRIYRDHLRHLHPEKLRAKVDKESAYCVECNRQYPSVHIYRRHLKESPRHTPKAPQSIPCPECGKIFRRKDNLRNHINHVHAIQKKFHCAMCNKSYANNWGLKCHNLNVHLKVPKVKDKICDLCGRGFNTTRVLVNHRRTHTGERPYACAFCSATFAQKTAMMTHQKTQHRDLNRSYNHSL